MNGLVYIKLDLIFDSCTSMWYFNVLSERPSSMIRVLKPPRFFVSGRAFINYVTYKAQLLVYI